MVMTGVERREGKRSNVRLLLIGQRESERIINGLTGSLVAHVAKSADGGAYAFVVLSGNLETQQKTLHTQIRLNTRETLTSTSMTRCEKTGNDTFSPLHPFRLSSGKGKVSDVFLVGRQTSSR